MDIHYIVTKEPTGGYSAEVPAMPGCFTQGDTLRELAANVAEAATAWIEAFVQVKLRTIPAT